MSDYIVSADGCAIRPGDRVFAYYATPIQFGTVRSIDADGWALVGLDDGTANYYDGERLAAEAPDHYGLTDERRCGAESAVHASTCDKTAGHVDVGDVEHRDVTTDRPSVLVWTEPLPVVPVPNDPAPDAMSRLDLLLYVERHDVGVYSVAPSDFTTAELRELVYRHWSTVGAGAPLRLIEGGPF